MAMNVLGNGLFDAKHYEDALSVQEAELSMWRRVGASGVRILDVQTNLSNTYARMGRLEEACQMERDIYRGRLKLDGEEDGNTLMAATNYATSLANLGRFEEAKALLRKTTPVARRVCGENREITLKARLVYGETLYKDPAASLDDLRGAVKTLEDTGRIARRVFGGTHPLAVYIVQQLQNSRAALAARETSCTCVPVPGA